jgi:hypothetical protein
MKQVKVLGVLSAAILGLAGNAGAAFLYTAILTGPNESPPNNSPGGGFASVIYDNVAHTLHVHVAFAGLTSGTTASHIHATTSSPGTGTAGVATTTPTFPNFPLGVTSGTYDNTLDLTSLGSYNPAFVTANGGTAASAEAVLAAAMAAGTSYLNIHTTNFGGGEIRGFLVPEPGGLTLLGTGAVVALAFYRRRAARPAA